MDRESIRLNLRDGNDREVEVIAWSGEEEDKSDCRLDASAEYGLI